jgi:hypothetical protein
MKHVLSLGILAAGLLVVAATVQAHEPADPVRQPAAPAAHAPRPCGAPGLSALRGTYALSATGWQDLSEINPALPKGYAPVSIIGAFKLDGNGDMTGWALINAGGVQMNAEFVNSQFSALKPDCSVAISLSMKINESGGMISGPYSYVGVIAGDPSALEVHFMMQGTGPGSHVDMNHAKRISMHVDEP